MNAVDNLTTAARRSLCLAMAFAIVTFGLAMGSIGADAVYAEAYLHATTTEVSVVQLASL